MKNAPAGAEAFSRLTTGEAAPVLAHVDDLVVGGSAHVELLSWLTLVGRTPRALSSAHHVLESSGILVLHRASKPTFLGVGFVVCGPA